ncbi:MAG: hypothetical protein ACUVUR_05720 [bacterium]
MSRNILVVMLGGTFLASCSVPIYDRAEITPGPMVTAGIGLGTGVATSAPPAAPQYPFAVGDVDYYSDLIGTLRLGYGFSERASVVMQGSLGIGKWLTGKNWAYSPLIWEFCAGLKLRTGPRSALQTTVGLPGLFDLVYLHDLNRRITVDGGIGLRGLILGINSNFPLNRTTTLFAAGEIRTGWEWIYNYKFVPVGSVGIGLGYKLFAGK